MSLWIDELVKSPAIQIEPEKKKKCNANKRRGLINNFITFCESALVQAFFRNNTRQHLTTSESILTEKVQ